MNPVKSTINYPMLNWARKTAFYDVDEIAQKLKVKPEKIEKWEHGYEEPTNKQLINLAQYYRRSPMLFYTSLEPTEEKLLPDFRTLPNKQKKQSSKIAFEIRSAKERRNYLITLEEENKENIKYKIQNFNENFFKYSFKNSKSLVSRITEEIWKKLEITKAKQDAKSPQEFLEFLITKLEGLGVLVFQFYNIKSEELRGYAIYHDKLPIIGINATEHPHGKIFTLFHELTHLFIEKDGISNINSFKLEDEIEIFCNRVAGEVLVPENLLLSDEKVKLKKEGIWEDYEIKKLSKQFNVSPAVIIRRLLTLNKISNDFYNQKNQEWEKEYIHKGKPIATPQNKKETSIDKSETPTDKSTKDNEKNYSESTIKSKVTKALNKNGNYYTKMLIFADEDRIITAENLSQYLGETLNTIESIKRIGRE